jgi:hypothetical protein
MIYQLGCGRLPFSGNMMDVMTAHMRTPPPPPTGLPAGAAAAILKALAKDPNERFATCGEFAEALAAGLAGSSSVVVPPSARKKPPFKALGLAAGLVIGLVGAAFMFRPGGGGKPGPLAFDAVHNGSQEVQLRSLDGSIHSLGLGMAPHFGPGPSQLTLLRDGALVIVDMNGNKISTLIEDVRDFDVCSDSLVYSQKGGLMKRAIENGKLSGQPVRLAERAYHLALSPDGTQVTFVADSAIWVMEIKTGKRRSLTSPLADEIDSLPCWSPDGRQLAFRREKSKNVSLYRVAVDGSGAEKPIPIRGVEPISLCWAPNSQLAFSAHDGIYRVGPDGSGLERLVEAPKGVILSRPAWGVLR